jgi:hypothetical protein
MSFSSVFGSPILWALNPSTASSFKPINGGIKIAVPAGLVLVTVGYRSSVLQGHKRRQLHIHMKTRPRESSLDDVERVNNALIPIRLIKICQTKNYNVSWKEIKSGTKAF